jgi:hypothetical protein
MMRVRCTQQDVISEVTHRLPDFLVMPDVLMFEEQLVFAWPCASMRHPTMVLVHSDTLEPEDVDLKGAFLVGGARHHTGRLVDFTLSKPVLLALAAYRRVVMPASKVQTKISLVPILSPDETKAATQAWIRRGPFWEPHSVVAGSPDHRAVYDKTIEIEMARFPGGRKFFESRHVRVEARTPILKHSFLVYVHLIDLAWLGAPTDQRQYVSPHPGTSDLIYNVALCQSHHMEFVLEDGVTRVPAVPGTLIRVRTSALGLLSDLWDPSSMPPFVTSKPLTHLAETPASVIDPAVASASASAPGSVTSPPRIQTHDDGSSSSTPARARTTKSETEQAYDRVYDRVITWVTIGPTPPSRYKNLVLREAQRRRREEEPSSFSPEDVTVGLRRDRQREAEAAQQRYEFLVGATFQGRCGRRHCPVIGKRVTDMDLFYRYQCRTSTNPNKGCRVVYHKGCWAAVTKFYSADECSYGAACFTPDCEGSIHEISTVDEHNTRQRLRTLVRPPSPPPSSSSHTAPSTTAVSPFPSSTPVSLSSRPAPSSPAPLSSSSPLSMPSSWTSSSSASTSSVRCYPDPDPAPATPLSGHDSAPRSVLPLRPDDRLQHLSSRKTRPVGAGTTHVRGEGKEEKLPLGEEKRGPTAKKLSLAELHFHPDMLESMAMASRLRREAAAPVEGVPDPPRRPSPSCPSDSLPPPTEKIVAALPVHSSALHISHGFRRDLEPLV